MFHSHSDLPLHLFNVSFPPLLHSLPHPAPLAFLIYLYVVVSMKPKAKMSISQL